MNHGALVERPSPLVTEFELTLTHGPYNKDI